MFSRLSVILSWVLNKMELDYAEIGRRIARRRKALGLKQVQVCERAGINDKYLSSIERAASIPSLEVLMKLAIALETTRTSFWWEASEEKMTTGAVRRICCAAWIPGSLLWQKVS